MWECPPAVEWSRLASGFYGPIISWTVLALTRRARLIRSVTGSDDTGLWTVLILFELSCHREGYSSPLTVDFRRGCTVRRPLNFGLCERFFNLEAARRGIEFLKAGERCTYVVVIGSELLPHKPNR